MKHSPDYTVDVRGAITPFSLLKVSLVFEQMKPRETMEIFGCDAEMQQDLLRLLPNVSLEYIGDGAIGESSAMLRVLFRKEPENR